MTVYQFELHAGTASQGVVGTEVIGIRGAGDRTRAMIAAKNFAVDWSGTIPEMRAVPAPRNVTNYVSARFVTQFEQDDEVQQKQAESWSTDPLEER